MPSLSFSCVCCACVSEGAVLSAVVSTFDFEAVDDDALDSCVRQVLPKLRASGGA